MITKWIIPLGITVIALLLWSGNPDATLPANKIDGIVFVDANHGFVQQATLSHPRVYEPLDGGRTWKQTSRPVPGFRRGRAFASELRGWSIGELDLDKALSSGSFDDAEYPTDVVYRTENGGET